MKNSYLTFLLLFVCFFVSCSDSNYIIEDEDEKEYELVSIMWKLVDEDGDGMEMISQKLPEKIYYNDGITGLPVEYNPLETVKQTSYFECENKDLEFLNKWMEKVEVVIPTEPDLLSSQYKYLGGVKAPLEFIKENEVEMTTKMSASTVLTPYTKMTYNGTAYLKKIKATYCLIFAAKDNRFDEVKIEGKWSGLIYHNSESSVVYDEIK